MCHTVPHQPLWHTPLFVLLLCVGGFVNSCPVHIPFLFTFVLLRLVELLNGTIQKPRSIFNDAL